MKKQRASGSNKNVPSCGAPRVLLAAAREGRLSGLEGALTDLGYETARAASCADAIATALEHGFDAVVMDAAGLRGLREEIETRIRERTADLEAGIAEIRRGDTSLRASEALYRGLGEAVPDFIWSVSKDGTAEFVNQRWMDYTGLTLDRATVPLEALHHPDDIPQLAVIMQEAIVKGEPFEVEFRFRRHDGVYRWFLARAAPIVDEQGRVTKWVGTSTDIHDRKLVEEELRRRQAEIEALNQRLQRAMTETHHRVKNSLQVIAALVDMHVLEGEDALPMEEVIRLGNHVRTLAVVHDVLTDQAKADGEAHWVCADAVLRRLLALLEQMAGRRAVLPLLEEVWLPARQCTGLALVTAELVTNSIKHGQGDVEVALRLESGAARLEVADSGPGFYPRSMSSHPDTTGKGLVENLVRWDLGGEIRFENRPVGGALVTVTVPLPPASGQE